MESEKLKRGALYDIIDRPSENVLRRAGITSGMPHRHGRIKARWTGEHRPPRKGEFYLSGAVIEAYRAPSDLTTPYHIAELVLVGPPVTTHSVIEVLTDE